MLTPKEIMEQITKRSMEDAEEIMLTYPSANAVLDALVAELGPIAIQYKMKGLVPSAAALQSAIPKLLAIVVATKATNNSNNGMINNTK